VTSPHGYNVTNIISKVAENANYNFFRIVADDKKFKVSNFLKAIEDVIEQDLDIVNISSGSHHENCRRLCRICDAINNVVSNNIVVVAGAGNAIDENKSMHCPAFHDEVISVGGFHTYCTLDPSSMGSTPGFRPSPSLPPNCYYLEKPEVAENPELYDQHLCGQGACTPVNECEDFRREVIWDGNIDMGTSEPTVFGPSHFAVCLENGDLLFKTGTSFSTAYVTGCLAGIFGALNRPNPTPSEVKSAISVRNTTVGDTNHRKFDSLEVNDFLRK
jgi:hypothetical protein